MSILLVQAGGVTQDPEYWTVLPLETGQSAREWYVKNGGDDEGTGVDDDNALATFGEAQARIYALGDTARPDHILFKCGDTFDMAAVQNWYRGGRSATYPKLISSYGSGARPIIRYTDTTVGMAWNAGDTGGYLAIVGVDFHQWARDPANGSFPPGDISSKYGISFNGNVGGDANPTYLLFEDCVFRYWGIAFNLSGWNGPVAFRRCIIRNSWAQTASDTHGFYYTHHQSGTCTWDECIFDHNTWEDDASLSGAGMPGSIGRDHEIYQTNFQDIPDTQSMAAFRFRRCLVLEGGVDLQFRNGATIEDCFWNRCNIALQLGGGTDPETNAPDGVDHYVRGCVVLEANAPSALIIRQGGFWHRNARSLVIDDNIVANGPANPSYGIGCGGTPAIPNRNVTINNNIFYKLRDCIGMSEYQLPAANDYYTITNNIFDQQHSGSGRPIIWTVDDFTNWTFSGNHYQSPNDAGEWFKVGTSETWKSHAQFVALTGEADSTTGATSFTDPTRTVAKYVDYVEQTSGSSTHDFYDKVLAQRKGAWDGNYDAINIINWIRAGFDKAPR